MKDFKFRSGLNVESLTDDQWVDASGKAWPIYSQRIAAVAGKFGNAGATTLAHGVANLNLSAPFNVRKVNCSNGTITCDATMMRITADVTNLNITTFTDLHLYTGEVVIEYSKSTD